MTLASPRLTRRQYTKTILNCEHCGVQFQPDGRGNHKAKYCRTCRYEMKQPRHCKGTKQ